MDDEGKWEVLAIEPVLEESRENYRQLIEKLKEHGLKTPSPLWMQTSFISDNIKRSTDCIV